MEYTTHVQENITQEVFGEYKPVYVTLPLTN